MNKAVEGLGAEKVVVKNADQNTVPNLEVRIGAIYALELIAKRSQSQLTALRTKPSFSILTIGLVYPEMSKIYCDSLFA